MSFASYTDLTTAIASWLARDDLATQIPDFIRLAEARMQRDLRPFPTRVANVAVPLSSTTGRAGPIPGLPGIVQLESVTFRVVDAALAFNPGHPLTHLTEAELLAFHDDAPLTGEPALYAVSGQDLLVYPFPNVPKDSAGANSSYSLLLTMVGPSASFAVPVTSGNFASNPIVRDHPDLYLYGALAEAAPYLQDEQRLPAWEARFTKTLREVNIQHDRLVIGPDFPRPQLSRVF